MGTKYVVLDLETSTKETYGRIANPFDKDNYIVSAGLKYSDGRKIKTHIKRGDVLPKEDWLSGVQAIIGINLKFDLLYLWRNPVLQAFFKRGGRIYDCQYARYFITAQQEKYASMDGMAQTYGLPLKPDKIKEYWKSGIDTIDIDEQELIDYLDHDLETTEAIFKCVAKEANELGMSAMIRERMDSLCGNIEMEFNGLKVDLEVADRNEKKLRKEIDRLYEELKQYTPELPEGAEFNWSSGRQLSAFLFGGPIKYKTRDVKTDELGNTEYYKKTVEVPALSPHGNKIYYKSGPKEGQLKTKKAKVDDETRPKYRVVQGEFKLPGLTKPKAAWELKEPGFYKTGEDVIKELSVRGVEVASILSQLKKREKDLSAFYSKGMLRYAQGGVIHHTLNNVQTDTGRLSSSKPNAQQIPRGNTSDVREMFVSHFEDGEVAEVDFSSLEVVIQAWISKDKNMIENVNEGVDFHCVVKGTEILTDLGWKRAEDVELSDSVASYKDGSVRYTPPLDKWVTDPVNTVRVCGDMIDEEVSIEHSCFIDRKRAPIKDFISEKVNQTRFTYFWESALEDYRVTDDYIRLLVWSVTDSKLGKRSKTGQLNGIHWKLSKPRKIKRLRDLLDRNSWKYSTPKCPKTGINKLQPTYTAIYGDLSREVVSDIGMSKKYPHWFNQLSSRQCRVVIEELAHTDGWKSGRKIVVSTTRQEDADTVQLLAVRSGYPAKIRKATTRNPFGTLESLHVMYYVSIIVGGVYDRRYVDVTLTGHKKPVVGITTIDGTLVTRNSGKVSVTGNCLRLAAKLGEEYEDVLYKAKKEKDPYYDLERTKAKGFSFQRAYGAGANAIAASTGMSVDEVKAFIEAENRMYPNVEKYNAWVVRQVEKNAEETGTEINGVPAKFGWHRATTGTNARYGFTQQEAPDFMKDKGVEVSFSPTQMKNYSIQGEAGGVVSTAVGMVWRKFVETDNFNNTALLMNTVHDCIWISLAKGAKEYVIPEVEKAMVAIPDRYNKVYGVDVPVVFRVESEVGPNMKDLN